MPGVLEQRVPAVLTWPQRAAVAFAFAFVAGAAAFVMFEGNLQWQRDLSGRESLPAEDLWLGDAVLAFTSGSDLALPCALVLGAAIAARWRGQDGLLAAVAAGAAMGAVNLGVAWVLATRRLGPVNAGGVEDPPARFAGRSPLEVAGTLVNRYPTVLLAIGLVFAGFLAAAAIGYGLTRLERSGIVGPLLLVPPVVLILATSPGLGEAGAGVIELGFGMIAGIAIMQWSGVLTHLLVAAAVVMIATFVRIYIPAERAPGFSAVVFGVVACWLGAGWFHYVGLLGIAA